MISDWFSAVKKLPSSFCKFYDLFNFRKECLKRVIKSEAGVVIKVNNKTCH